MKKVWKEVGSSLIMFGPSNWSSSRARLKPCQVIDSVNLGLIEPLMEDSNCHTPLIGMEDQPEKSNFALSH